MVEGVHGFAQDRMRVWVWQLVASVVATNGNFQLLHWKDAAGLHLYETEIGRQEHVLQISFF